MIIEDSFEQLSEQWFEARLGNPGASKFFNILTNVTAKPSKQAQSYMYQLAGEILSGTTEEGYSNDWMLRGIETEQEARDYFEFTQDIEVRQVAMCYPDEHKKYHCSPDGLTSDGGGLEIKCPKMTTHVKYLVDGKFPKADYNAQVQGSLLVTGLSHWWFMSYYRGLKPFILKVLPDNDYIDALKKELDGFCENLEKVVAKLR